MMKGVCEENKGNKRGKYLKNVQSTPKKGQNNVRRGQIYYADLRGGEGSELDKIRPCVVIQNDKGNQHSPTTIIVPIAHRNKNMYLPTQIELKENMLNDMSNYVDGVIMAEQIRVVSKSRLKNLIGELVPNALELLDNAMKVSIGLK